MIPQMMKNKRRLIARRMKKPKIKPRLLKSRLLLVHLPRAPPLLWDAQRARIL
jgi:hypothetical protein